MPAADSCSSPDFLPDRRTFFRGAGGTGLSLLGAAWQRAMAAGPSGRGTTRSVILIFNAGAPSHLDLFDPKPDAPDTVRGPFRSVPTSAPGVRFSELLPRL